MNMRPATQKDLNTVYMMGYDVWSEGATKSSYLKGCRESPKYKKGIWYVLEKNGTLLSSLIIYDFKSSTYGIGSIATPPDLRRKGHASVLVKQVINTYRANDETLIFFLYSDVNPEFYMKFCFQAIPDAFQNHPPSICMVNPVEAIKGIEGHILRVPSYF